MRMLTELMLVTATSGNPSPLKSAVTVAPNPGRMRPATTGLPNVPSPRPLAM